MPTGSQALATAFQEHRKGNLKQARDLYCGILEHDPGQPDAWQLLGLLAHQAGDHESAIACMKKALVRDALNAATHANLGSAYLALERLSEAEESLRKAVSLQPSLAEAHNNLGNVLRRRALWDESAECFRTALRLRPEYPEALNNLGALLLDQEKAEEALACFNQVVGLNPNYAAALNNQGSACTRSADRRKRPRLISGRCQLRQTPPKFIIISAISFATGASPKRPSPATGKRSP